jgi:hypothetical protein
VSSAKCILVFTDLYILVIAGVELITIISIFRKPTDLIVGYNENSIVWVTTSSSTQVRQDL